MRVQELRRGNLISRKGVCYTFHSVDNGDDNRICVDRIGIVGRVSWFYINEGDPIKPSDEWLRRLGFEEFKKDCRTFFVLNGLKLERSNGGHIYYKKMYISSIHHLQNLYFALKQEELIYI